MLYLCNAHFNMLMGCVIWKYMLKSATACGNEKKHVDKRDHESASIMFNCMWQAKQACSRMEVLHPACSNCCRRKKTHPRKIQHDEEIQSMIWKYKVKFATECGNENKHVDSWKTWFCIQHVQLHVAKKKGMLKNGGAESSMLKLRLQRKKWHVQGKSSMIKKYKTWSGNTCWNSNCMWEWKKACWKTWFCIQHVQLHVSKKSMLKNGGAESSMFKLLQKKKGMFKE